MGIAVHAMLVMLGTLAAAWLTSVVERRLVHGEAGPEQAGEGHCRVRLPNRDRWLYPSGPLVALAGALLGAVVIPFGPGLVGEDLGIGAFYFIVVIDFVVLGIALTGWGSNAPNGIEACYRIVAQLVAYVVPLGLAIVGAIMMAKSLSTVRIVEAQSELWFIVLQPLGFLLYLVTGLMQSYRAPFMEPFAASIDGGVAGISGNRGGILWRIALSAVLFLVAAMGAVLFLGGWHGPWLPAPLWMLLKTMAMMVLMVVLGRKFRPRSTAQMLALSWKLLIPLGLLNVLLVGALILLDIGPA